MKKIKAFFYILAKSATSPAYYRDVISTSLGFSIKYFLMFALVISVVSGVASLIVTLPKIDKTLGNLTEEVKKLYPQDLIVKIENGQLSINQPEPYFIKFPDSEKLNEEFSTNGQNEETQIPENLVVIDTNGTLDSLETYKTLILLNRTNILTKNPQTGKIEAYPIKDMPNGEFSKETFTQLMDKMNIFINLIPYLYFFLISLFLFMYNFVFRLSYALFLGVILLIAASFLKVELKYTKHFKIALHVLTLPMIIEAAKDLILPLLATVTKNSQVMELPQVPWFLAISVIFGVLALKAIAKGNTQPVVITQTKDTETKTNSTDAVDTTKNL